MFIRPHFSWQANAKGDIVHSLVVTIPVTASKPCELYDLVPLKLRSEEGCLTVSEAIYRNKKILACENNELWMIPQACLIHCDRGGSRISFCPTDFCPEKQQMEWFKNFSSGFEFLVHKSSCKYTGVVKIGADSFLTTSPGEIVIENMESMVVSRHNSTSGISYKVPCGYSIRLDSSLRQYADQDECEAALDEIVIDKLSVNEAFSALQRSPIENIFNQDVISETYASLGKIALTIKNASSFDRELAGANNLFNKSDLAYKKQKSRIAALFTALKEDFSKISEIEFDSLFSDLEADIAILVLLVLAIFAIILAARAHFAIRLLAASLKNQTTGTCKCPVSSVAKVTFQDDRQTSPALDLVRIISSDRPSTTEIAMTPVVARRQSLRARITPYRFSTG